MLVAKKDVYVDKHDRVTTDMSQAAAQIAVAGHVLDERVVKRYGIADTLESVDEPRALRMVRNKPEPKIETESEPKAETPEAPAAEPKAKKGAKNK
jgi:hypothetical protein